MLAVGQSLLSIESRFLLRPGRGWNGRRFPVYTAGMRSVADEFRERDRKAVLALSVQERIELALSLGEADLDIFCRAQGVDRATGIRLLRRQRQVGRAPSKVMQEID